MVTRAVWLNWRAGVNDLEIGERGNTLVLDRSDMNGTDRSLDLDARLKRRTIGMRCCGMRWIPTWCCSFQGECRTDIGVMG